MQKNPNVTTIIVERSVYSDFVFLNLLMKNETLTETEYNMYMEIAALLKELTIPLSGVILLDCDVETALTRIKKRGRSEESSVTKQYQLALQKEYDNWIETNVKKVIPYIRILSVDQDSFEWTSHFQKIVDFINIISENK